MDERSCREELSERKNRLAVVRQCEGREGECERGNEGERESIKIYKFPCYSIEVSPGRAYNSEWIVRRHFFLFPPVFFFFFLFRTFINPDELSPIRRDSLLVSVELPFLFYPSGYTFPRTVVVVVARGRANASERFSLVNCDFIL